MSLKFQHTYRHFLSLVLVSFLVLLPQIARSAPAIIDLDIRKIEGMRVAPNLQFYKDDSRLLTLKEIKALQRDGAFQDLNGPASVGVYNGKAWTHFQLRNTGDTPLPILLEFTDHAIHLLTYHIEARNADIAPIKATFNLQSPSSERPTHYNRFAAEVTLEPGVVYDIFTSGAFQQAGPIFLDFKIWTPDALINHTVFQNVLWGVFFGFLILTSTMSIVAGRAMKDPVFYSYACYALSNLWIYSLFSGTAQLYVVTGGIHWMYQTMASGLTVGFGIQFTRQFLETRKNMPRMDWLLIALATIAFAQVPVSIFDMGEMSIALLELSFLSYPALILVGLIRVFQGQYQATIFALSWGLYTLAVFTFSARDLGLAENSDFVNYVPIYGTAVEIFLFTLALGWRARNFRNEAERIRVAYLGSLENRKQELEDQVSLRTQELALEKQVSDQRGQNLADLMNNSDQGFMAFDASRIVAPDYSRACESFFGQPPAGHHVSDLLFGDEQSDSRELFENSISQALQAHDPYLQDMILTLIPTDFARNGYHLKAAYRVLDNGRMMMILTDVSNEVSLQAKLHREHERMSMIVAAVSDPADFQEIVAEFDTFLADPYQGETPNRAELYRRIHTFKGLFNQFNFIDLPQILHDVEQKLAKADNTIVTFDALKTARNQDLKIIQDSLGEEFLDSQKYTRVRAETLYALYEELDKLSVNSNDQQAPDFVKLRNIVHALVSEDIKSMLRPLTRGAAKLADRQAKEVEFVIDGPSIDIDREQSHAFVASLVHLFRNAIDHGIEDAEAREEAEKEEIATIRTEIASNDNHLLLHISDDGKGMDPAIIREKLVEKQILDKSTAAATDDRSILQFVMTDNFSTRSDVTDISGRGIGMAATRAEVEKLGGQMMIESTPGAGSRISITVPLHALRKA